MLAIRMQRLGRKGHPTYRIVVQDVRQTPSSGKYVALLGSYDPHAKTNTLVKDKAEFYLTHGAQPSERVARLFTSEGITLPSWVKQASTHTRTTRNAVKLRKNQPAVEVPAEEPAAEVEAAETAPEAATDAPTDSAETTDAPEVTAEPETAEATEDDAAVAEEPAAEPVEVAEATPKEADKEPEAKA
ncbi:MAG: 30S ribosomal protein S16 [Candidatus Saccharimonadales bacterium]